MKVNQSDEDASIGSQTNTTFKKTKAIKKRPA
jgi:hypothetical protein